MAPCIEEKGGVAPLGAGLQRKVALFGHRFPVDSVVRATSRRRRTLAGKT
jgi:hypothetical protein